MMLTKDVENRKMLAAFLGLDEEEANRRLNIEVAVSCDAADTGYAVMGSDIQAILSRTVRVNGSTDPIADPRAEVILGGACARAKGSQKVWVGVVEEGVLVSREPIRLTETRMHPIFKRIAACYASGFALRLAIGDGLPFRGSDSILISPAVLLGADLGAIERPCEFGEALLAGGGAVANGFLFGLQSFDVRGRLHVVDPKHVRDGILNRCIWFTEDDVGYAKAQRLALRAQPRFPRLELVPHEATVRDVVHQDSVPLTRLITTVDSRRVRRSLQREIPGEVFDTSTTGVEEIVLHFNKQPSGLACLCCIYRREQGEISHEAHVADALGVTIEDVQSGFVSPAAALRLCLTFPDLTPEEVIGKAYDTLFKARCAEQKLKIAADRQVLAPFCFVSMLAGTYLALETIRRINTARIAEPYNYWRLSPWHSPVLDLRNLRQSLADCEYCADPVMREVANAVWGDRFVPVHASDAAALALPDVTN